MSENRVKRFSQGDFCEQGVANDAWGVEWLPAEGARPSGGDYLDHGYLCRLSISTQPKNIIQVCDYVCSVCQSLLTAEQTERVQTALVEALTNAMIHGNLEVDSFHIKRGDWDQHNELIRQALNDSVLSERRVILEFQCVNEKIVFSIEDEGSGFIASEFDRLGPEDIHMSECGRGLMMIRFCMDEVSWSKRRNRITMTKNIA
ncbi:MAG: ATP-binding protein [Oceanococcus sp.]